MNDIVDIVENKIKNEEILHMYEQKQISKSECLLLLSTESYYYFYKYVTGLGEFKLYYDSSVDTSLYFTNVPEMLKSFYSMHLKFPNYHFDKMLDKFLLSITNMPGCVYIILTILSFHIKNEKDGISTFKLNNIYAILENCKNTIKGNMQFFKETKMYEAINKQNGYLDIIEKYNKEFKNYLNFDLFSEDTNKNKVL